MKLDDSLFYRRDLLNGLVVTGALGLGAVAGHTVLGYLTGLEVPEPDHVTVTGPALDVLAKERFVLVPYGPRPVMVYRLQDGQLRAVSAVCTHSQCNVRYRPDSNDIYCGCHHGRFTAEGVNVPGTPPPRPLRAFHVRRQDDGSLLVSADQPSKAASSVAG
jgi:cytochrome b6-f complex iron-sulfur subunit